MKLSIITPVYKDQKLLEKYLDKMTNQTSKNFELIVVVDTNNNKTLEAVQKYRGSFGKRLKLIFNSKRFSRYSALNLGGKAATGEYALIMSLGNKFDDNLVKQSIEIIKEKGTDIIEFRAKMHSPFKFDGKIRKSFNQPVDPSVNTEVHAFTYPFDFNKLYRTEILVSSAKYKLPVNLNSRFSISATYLSLLGANSYSTVNKVLVTSRSKNFNNINPLKMIRQWESLEKLVKDYTAIETIERYIYAHYFTEVVFMAPLVKATKNKVLIKKFNEKFKKQRVGIFKDLFETNKYVNIKSCEYKTLSSHTSLNSLAKAHKELG